VFMKNLLRVTLEATPLINKIEPNVEKNLTLSARGDRVGEQSRSPLDREAVEIPQSWSKVSS